MPGGDAETRDNHGKPGILGRYASIGVVALREKEKCCFLVLSYKKYTHNLQLGKSQ